MKKTLEDQLYVTGWILLFCILILAFFMRRAGAVFTDFVPGCVLFTLTGFYCPGCGATRALSAFMSGHFLRSFVYHPIVDYCAFVYLCFMLSQSAERLSGGRLAVGMRYKSRWLYISLFILIGHCLLRNALKVFWGIGIPL